MANRIGAGGPFLTNINADAPSTDNPPPYVPLPPAILRAWQPEVRVTILTPPGGGGVDDTPPRSRASDQIIRNAWRQDWAAQGGERNAGLVGIDNPPPAQSYGAAIVRSAWGQTWSAQTGERSAAWDPGIASDPPPPFVRQLPQILGAWQPNYSVTLLRPTGGGDVPADNPPLHFPLVPLQIAQAWQQTWVAQGPERSLNWNVDNPPPRGLPRVDALWQVSWPAQGPGKTSAWNTVAADDPPREAAPIAKGWDQIWPAQSAPKNAAWNFVAATPDNPPPLKAYPAQVFSAWQPNVTVTLLRPTGGGSVAGDDPPPKQDYAQQRIRATWSQDWAAQRAPKNAAWNFVLVTPDDPPFGRRVPNVGESWYGTYKTFDVRGSGESMSVDDPPWRQDWGINETLAKWNQTWAAQRAPTSAAWNFQAPVVDNPPPRSAMPAAINASWQSGWKAQGPDQNAAWNVDNPPPRQDFARQQVGALWQMTWPAQGPSKNAAWNFVPPVIDDPQPLNQYRSAQIVAAAWQQNWLAQSKSPIGWIFPEPVPEVVPPAQFDTGSRSGSGGGEPVKKRKPQPIQRRAGAKNTFVSLDSGKIYDKGEAPAAPKAAPATKAASQNTARDAIADATEEQEAAEIMALLDKLFNDRRV